MASPASTHETITVSENPTLLNVNMTNVTKLTASNFLMWSRQVLALLDGYDLSGYVDGSVEIPSPTNTAEGVQVPNPAYALWRRQDRLIYSALLGAITVSIQPLLSTTTTSAQIWETLVAIYAKPSRATSYSSHSKSNIGRKVLRRLMRTSKVSLHGLIKSRCWENRMISKIRSSIYLKGYLKSIKLLLIR